VKIFYNWKKKGYKKRSNYRKSAIVILLQCGETVCCFFNLDKIFYAKIYV